MEQRREHQLRIIIRIEFDQPGITLNERAPVLVMRCAVALVRCYPATVHACRYPRRTASLV